MLVLSRKADESILIDGRIRVTVVAVRGNQVRLGIEAPPVVHVLREELVTVPVDVDTASESAHRRLAFASLHEAIHS